MMMMIIIIMIIITIIIVYYNLNKKFLMPLTKFLGDAPGCVTSPALFSDDVSSESCKLNDCLHHN